MNKPTRHRSHSARLSLSASPCSKILDYSDCSRFFLLVPERGEIPKGFSSIRIATDGILTGETPALLHIPCDAEGKVEMGVTLPLVAKRSGELTGWIRAPAKASSLVLEVQTDLDPFTVKSARLRPLSRTNAAARLALSQLPKFYRGQKSVNRSSHEFWAAWRRAGLKSAVSSLGRQLSDEACYAARYCEWVNRFEVLSPEDRERLRERVARLGFRPLYSLAMPVSSSNSKWVEKAIDAIQRQVYSNWELLLLAAPGWPGVLREKVASLSRKGAAITVVPTESESHSPSVLNQALAAARGEFISFLDADDELSEHALCLVSEEINLHQDADVIYSDADRITPSGARLFPCFKPDWNPDLFYAYHYLGRLCIYRTSLLKRLGGFRSDFEAMEDYDLALRAVESTSAERIRHVPHVLYHRRIVAGDPSEMEAPFSGKLQERARAAVQAHLDRKGIAAKVVAGNGPFNRVRYSLPALPPKVSLVICTRDRLKLLAGIVSGVLEKTDYPSLELILVDNQSVEPETMAYLAKLREDPRVKVIRHEAPFNFSELNNLGARQSTGELLGLLNNDLEVISSDWLKEMVSHALRPEVGAVGAKLYYPNDTIQHAGVILGVGGIAGHSHKYLRREWQGFMGRAAVTQNLSAVTAACLVMRRKIFEEVGGLDEHNLKVAFNDVDFCLRIRQRGYQIVWTPYAELYHLESASRGPETTPENIARFGSEIAFMTAQWGDWQNDPFYSPNLSLHSEDFSLAFPPRTERPWKDQPESGKRDR